MLQTLNMIDMNKDLPTTNVLGVIPKRIGDDTTFELSDEIITAVKTMEEVIIKYLLNLDIKMKIKNEDATIENISLISFKRDIINGPKI
jgi:hydrogenase maturation protease